MPKTLTASGPVRARPLRGLAERERAVLLYRATFGLADTDPAMTPKLVAALQHNGGSAVGAFDEDEEMVGFTYGFVGLGSGRVYHYSQAAVVAADHQGRGIGRLLKLAQAEIARDSGLFTMRWAYDPMIARNAHFNLDVLGARGRWFHHDYYEQTDAAGRSDRVVVEWDLSTIPDTGVAPGVAAGATVGTAGRTAAPVDPTESSGLRWGHTRQTDEGGILVIPASWSDLIGRDPGEASRVRDQVADQLSVLLDAGLALVSCHRLDDTRAAYRLRPVAAELSESGTAAV